MLTPHFATCEFDQPARHGFDAVPYPAEWVESRLLPLCELLEVLREFFGEPIEILSGYRSPAYNAAVGGVVDSQHTHGRAADIIIHSTAPAMVHAAVRKLFEMEALPQLGGLGEYATFCHIDIRPRGPREHLAQWTGTRGMS